MTRPALLVLTLALAGASPAGAQSHAGRIEGWQSPEEGFARARAERRAILLFFTADW